jgi:citrate lyase subunit beta/citryl-CoA lyase
MLHPRQVLHGSPAGAALLPVCDHYSGTPERMRKSLALQAEMTQEFGRCVFDVTLDCEDGAPVGGELEQAHRIAALAVEQASITVGGRRLNRVGVRVHPLDHLAFAGDVQTIVGGDATALDYLMLPKIESVADVDVALAAIDQAVGRTRSDAGLPPMPLHVLIESPGALAQVLAIARHPRVESLSFGLMDFVSAHGGAIPASAMAFDATGHGTLDQFTHPLVRRAKLEIAAACHAYAKVPSHCVVTEFRDVASLERAAQQASHGLGFTRMWSIHPDQIRPILRAFAPSAQLLEQAQRIIEAAQAQDWAPVAVDGVLHDRASYRYFWQLIESAHRSGVQIAPGLQTWLIEPADGVAH